jgi:hypothetical protein
MPEKQQSQKHYTFLEIYGGKLVERSREPKPNFVETVVYEKDKKTARGITYLRHVSGLEQFLLRAITYEDKTLPDGITRIRSLKVDFQDATDSDVIYRVQFRCFDVITSTLMKKLPNIPFGEPLDISLFPDKDDKTKTILNIKNSNGEPIRVAYTKENPNGLPEAKYYKSSDEWDFKEQNEFLLDNTRTIAEALKQFWRENEDMFTITPKPPITNHQPSTKSTHPVISDELPLDSDDKLPF